MDLRVELVTVLVNDVDAAKDFDVETLGFHVEMDEQLGPDYFVARLIAPRSCCDTVLSISPSDAAAGSVKGCGRWLNDQRVDSSGPSDFVKRTRVDRLHLRCYLLNTFLDFADPDENTSRSQEVPAGN